LDRGITSGSEGVIPGNLSERFLADHGNISGSQPKGNERAADLEVEFVVKPKLCRGNLSASGFAFYQLLALESLSQNGRWMFVFRPAFKCSPASSCGGTR
jgi:hypothetical protein